MFSRLLAYNSMDVLIVLFIKDCTREKKNRKSESFVNSHAVLS